MLTAFVTGNLGRDGELRDAGGDKVLSFSVASSKKVKGQAQTTWVRCSVWGKRGESLAQHMTKGKKVAVTGELSMREHNGKSYLELRVAELEFMGGGSGTGGGKPKSDADDSGAADDESSSRNDTKRDDLPF